MSLEDLGKLQPAERATLRTWAQGTFWNDDRNDRAIKRLDKYDPAI